LRDREPANQSWKWETEDLKNVIRDDTAPVSETNNETGTWQPVEETSEQVPLFKALRSKVLDGPPVAQAKISHLG